MNNKINNTNLNKNKEFDIWFKSNKNIKLDNILIGVLLVIIIVSGNYLGQMIGCNFQYLFTTDVLFKNLILIFTIYFTLSISNTTLTHPFNNFKFSMLLYIIFKIFTRMPKEYSFICIIILTFITVSEQYKSYLLGIQNYDKYKLVTKRQQNLVALFLILLIVGHIRYIKTKYLRYGKKFNIIDFYFFGGKCKIMNGIKS
mgnify:CR=1